MIYGAIIISFVLGYVACAIRTRYAEKKLSERLKASNELLRTAVGKQPKGK